MAENVFILGAGASADAGAPLMGNFLDKAEDLLRNTASDIDRDAFSNVFELISDLQSVYAKSYLDLNNIEALFGAIEMGRIINILGKRSGDEISISKQSLVRLIVETLEKNISFPTENYSVIPTRSYQRLVQFIRQLQQETAIITFNYDVALDMAIYSEGLEINYGLDNTHHDQSIDCLKLHGSLNWGRCSDPQCQKIVPYPMRTFFRDFGAHLARQFRVDDKQFQQPVRLEISTYIKRQAYCNHQGIDTVLEDLPVIVPPTWNKTDYHGFLTNVWRKAAEHLATARNIYVIGYSLPESDAFFRYLFALGVVGQSRIQRFWVFDPDNSGVVEQRYERLLGESIRSRFKYYPHKFNVALEMLETGLFSNVGIYS